MGIKITAADTAFSNCLREAHDHTCEKCGRQGRMETSHVHSRRHRNMRWMKLNANCLCASCHRWWHENPTESGRWFEEIFGSGRVDILLEKKRTIEKTPKSIEKEVSAHYRAELEKIKTQRMSGKTGYIDFVSFQ